MTRRAGPLEIVVAGAGPVGLLFAWRLARESRASGVGIRIVDAKAPAGWQAQRIDPRVYALSREAQCLLGDLWQTMAARRVCPYRRMRVWEGDAPEGSAAITFDAAEIAEPDLGHIVEDSLIRSVLLDDLARADVRIGFGVGVEAVRAERGAVSIRFSDGTAATVDLVVGADGGESKVRAAAGIDAVRKDYRQRAVVTHVASEKPHGETAWQRFLPEGPLAFLPLADGQSSIVWTSSEARAAELLAAGDEAFVDALQTASAGVLGRLGPCAERLAFPLRLSHAIRYTRPGVALIGDAAHAVHPLAGQGMNLGMRDAAVLGDVLVEAIERGEYPGDERVLRRYERRQKAHNLGMQLAFDGLNELFGRRAPPWVAPVRGLGLACFDRLAPAKRILMRRALGLDRALA
jgi:ubiquinone biosynthesis UbiH/UbiF/VisC/COQ6 family hydroxylase